MDKCPKIVSVQDEYPERSRKEASMKKTEGLKIFTRLYDLTIWMMQKTMKFPKNQRFVLAQRMDNIMIEMLENLVMANMSQEKSQRLMRVSESLESRTIMEV